MGEMQLIPDCNPTSDVQRRCHALRKPARNPLDIRFDSVGLTLRE